jgi:hypothetical protein
MKYNYNVRTGLVRVKTNTKKYFYSGLAAVTVLAFGTGATFAAQPSQPGCFGKDRAAAIKTQFLQDGSWNYNTSAGASDWGQIAATRAGTNGTQNSDYKTVCGGDSVL